MNDEVLFERLASHDGPATPDGAFDNRLFALLEDELRAGRPWSPVLLLAATLVLVLTITAALAVGSGLIKLPWVDRVLIPGPSPTSTAVESPSASELPVLDMPGSRSSPAGEYGWTGGSGSWSGMHKVVMGDDGYRMIQIVFATKENCFADGVGSEPVAVTVAGRDGSYVEPFDGPNVLFMPEREAGQTTGAYALPIDDGTLCVYLTWDASTTPDELDAARQVVESIRGQSIRGATYGTVTRIVFTLPEGWDTG
jgi:hypothetical protein